MKTLFTTGMLFFSASVSSHGLDKEIAECASVIGRSARIACYDSLAQNFDLHAKPSSQYQASSNGNWVVSEVVNPIDDSETITIRLRETPGKNKWREAIDLVARCRDGNTELFISWNNFLGGEAHVLTRVGNEKAVGAHWHLSNDKRTTFHSQPISFLRTLSTSDKLVAQITPYNDNPITAIFDTSGLDNALTPIKEVCNWEGVI